MKICVVIGQTCAREWHNLLARRLVHDQHEVAIFVSEGGTPFPALLATTLAFERLVYGIAARSLLTAIRSINHSMGSGVLTMPMKTSTSSCASTETYLLRPLARVFFYPVFNGFQSEVGAVHAILDGQEVMIGVESSGESSHANGYAIETELPTIIGKTLDNACARMIDLLAWHCTPTARRLPDLRASIVCRAATLRLVRHAAVTLAKRLLRRLDMLARGGDRWMIGWRHAGNRPLEVDGGEHR